MSDKTSENINIHILKTNLLRALWVIDYLTAKEKNRFTPKEIANYLIENCGIETSRQAIDFALKSKTGKKLTNKNKKGFALMKLGQDELIKQTQKEKVMFIEPGKPFAAGIELESIFSLVRGTLKISDPYVDVKTLDVLYRCFRGRSINIEILTAQIKNEQNFKREILKLQYEGCNVEVRKIDTKVLHDRYFINKGIFWLSGNSLNNIGKKESFIVALRGDIHKTMLKIFDSRWQLAITI